MDMYWLVKLDDLRSLFGDAIIPFGLVAAMAFCSFFASLIVWGLNGKENCDGKAALRVAKLSGWLFFPSLILAFIMGGLDYGLPSTKQMAAIIVVPRIVNAAENSPELQKIPGKILVLASDWLEELRPAAEKAKDAIKTEATNATKSVNTAKKAVKAKMDSVVKSGIEQVVPIEKGNK